MKPIFKILNLICLAATLSSCTSAHPSHNKYSAETQNRNVSGFHAISSSGSFDVVLRQGNTEAVKVDADAEVINDVVTEVQNGVLKIHSSNKHNWGNFWNNRNVTVYVTAKNVDEIGLSGSGDLKIEDQLNTNNLELHISGSGNCQGKINVKKADVSVSGSGDFKIAGNADESDVRISGSGNFEASALITKTTAIHVSGSGNARVFASESLDASVSGSGDVRYSGHPKNVSKVAHGSGDISGS